MHSLNRTFLGAIFTLATVAAAPALANVADNLKGNKSEIQASIPDSKGSAGVYLSAGFGPAFYTGSSGWSLNVNALIPLKAGTGFYVGGEAAAAFWGFTSPAGIGPNVASSATALTIAPTAIYRFDVWESVHPYIGLTLGPTFYSQDVNGTRSNRLLLQIAARPGVFTALSDSISLQAEGKLGLLGGDFFFNPHVNVSFAL